MTRRANNSRRLAALRASVLLLFLPAHLAFVVLIDLHFIPDGGPPASLVVEQNEAPEPSKERLRVQLLKPSPRVASLDCKYALVFRDLEPWGLTSHVLTAGEIVAAALTEPASIRIWLAATPHNHRAPPA